MTGPRALTRESARAPALLRGGLWLAAGLAAFAAAHLLDRPVWDALLASGWARRSAAGIVTTPFEITDWYKALRVLGYLGTWFAVAAVFVLTDSARAAPAGRPATWSRGPYLLASTILGGALAEGLKLLLRRARPEDSDGAYSFIPWSTGDLSTGDFGLPSSHAAVAFAAAAALAVLLPRAWPVLFAAAAGCAATRVLAGQHFVSDVALAAVVGIASAWVLAHAFGGRSSPSLPSERPA